jgi:hypothetical protein
VEGGTSSSSGDTGKIPVTLEEKRKALEKLVRDMAKEREDIMAITCQKSVGQATRNWEDVLDQEKMEALTRVAEKMQTKAGEVKVKAKRLTIDAIVEFLEAKDK